MRLVLLMGLGLFGLAVLGATVCGWLEARWTAWAHRRLSGVVLVPWLRRSGALVRMGRR